MEAHAAAMDAIATPVHAPQDIPELTAKFSKPHVTVIHVKTEVHVISLITDMSVSAHAVTQEPTVRHTQAHARTIHA